jgi:hypothetical protein
LPDVEHGFNVFLGLLFNLGFAAMWLPRQLAELWCVWSIRRQYDSRCNRGCEVWLKAGLVVESGDVEVGGLMMVAGLDQRIERF